MQPLLQWIEAQLPSMKQTLIDWANHNSHTLNVEGTRWMASRVRERLERLGAQTELIELPDTEAIDDHGDKVSYPLGPAVHGSKRPNAAVKILFNIHCDTVYPIDHAFQHAREVDANTLNGPGVVDAKGGLIILLTVLEALERSDFAERIGWEVLVNPDEEIGSPSSAPLLIEAAKRNQFGLVYEPALPDGNLVGERKGSGTFTFVIHGKAAHAGRDFAAGRNAIVAAAELVRELHHTNGCIDGYRGRNLPPGQGTTLNIGKITGGGASNVVPDRCVVTLNVRTVDRDDTDLLDWYLHRAIEIVHKIEGIRVERFGELRSPPKPLDAKSRALLDVILDAGRAMGMELSAKPSGGTCDGNKLAAAGLPVIDSMGPRGGNLHSPEEFIQVDSLVERAKLSLLTLQRLAGSI